MKIIYYRGARPNFGDELNIWLWPKLIPDFFDDNEETAFFGIGSIIGLAAPGAVRRIIFGAGYVKDYFEKPDITGSDWHVYFVRGPQTAKTLALDPAYSLGDPAILVGTLPSLPPRTAELVSFMPHWESVGRGNWQHVCQCAGLNFIDPTRPVEEIIAELCRSRLVLTEAMHGAIVADSLRIPWVALSPIGRWNRDKWFDWAEAFDLDLHSSFLWPSSLEEAAIAAIHRPILAKFARLLKKLPKAGLVEKALAYLAAYRLKQLAKRPGCRSSDQKMETVTAKMLAKIDQLRRDYPDR